MSGRILVLDDEEGIRLTLGDFLESEGHQVDTAERVEEAIAIIDTKEFDLVFADILLPDASGIDLLRTIKDRGLACLVVMITGEPNIDTASEAVRLGAFDYIAKPFQKKDLLHITDVALRYKAMSDNERKHKLNLDAIFRSVGDSIITVDNEMKIIELNKAACDFLDTDCEVALGTDLWNFAPDEGNRCTSAIEDTIRTKKTVEIFRHEFRGPGRGTATLIASPLLDDSGKVMGAVLLIRDETRIDTLERDLSERRQFHNIVGKNPEMQKIYSLLESLADVKSTVLITGESGTGKSLVAEAIHYKGSRCSGPFVKVDCASLPDELLESELFGHVKGAFTGAISDREGRFSKAHGGTIFLDEIGDISPRMQLRLLRVLQDSEFEKVGSETPIKVDVRVIAATNRNLGKLIKAGRFREDLFFRIKVMEIHIPTLSQRIDDLPFLIKHCIKVLNKDMGKWIQGVSDEVTRAFMLYGWPGNVRELKNTMERAFIICRGDVITLEDLPSEIGNVSRTDTDEYGYKGVSPESLLDALRKTSWNKSKAARLLNVDRKTIYRKISEYNLEDKK